LYKVYLDGSERILLFNGVPLCINVISGWFYHLEYKQSDMIFKVRTDKTG